MNSIDSDGAYQMWPRLNGFIEVRALQQTFPDPLSAAEEMEGELAVGEANRNQGKRWRGTGPSLAQVLEDGDD